MMLKVILFHVLVVGLVVAADIGDSNGIVDRLQLNRRSCDPSAPPPVCPQNTNFWSKFPHQSDCTKFYLCKKGKPELLKCAGILHFNVKQGYCDWPSASDCKCAEPPEEPPTHVPATCGIYAPKPKCPETPMFYSYEPHQYDCSKSYACQYGVATENECKQPGWHFTSTSVHCVPPEKSDCECYRKECNPSAPVPTCPEHDPNGSAVHLAHQYDCAKFYKCDHGVPHVFDCPAGLHFNPILEVCDSPAAAGCKCW